MWVRAHVSVSLYVPMHVSPCLLWGRETHDVCSRDWKLQEALDPVPVSLKCLNVQQRLRDQLASGRRSCRGLLDKPLCHQPLVPALDAVLGGCDAWSSCSHLATVRKAKKISPTPCPPSTLSETIETIALASERNSPICSQRRPRHNPDRGQPADRQS